MSDLKNARDNLSSLKKSKELMKRLNHKIYWDLHVKLVSKLDKFLKNPENMEIIKYE